MDIPVFGAEPIGMTAVADVSMCVQPAFIIGTNNEDGTHNFAPITWVSVSIGKLLGKIGDFGGVC